MILISDDDKHSAVFKQPKEKYILSYIYIEREIIFSCLSILMDSFIFSLPQALHSCNQTQGKVTDTQIYSTSLHIES